MFFVVTKLLFETQPSNRDKDLRELNALVEKIRARYKISVQIADEFHKGGEAGIVVSAVGSEEMSLSKLIDSIADVCENSGYGRIHSENTILEDFESYTEEYE